MIRYISLVVAAAISLAAAPAFAATPCYDPETFGAHPNDGLDDAGAIQTAVNMAGANGYDVCIGAGTWNIFPRNADMTVPWPARLYSVFVSQTAYSVRVRGVGSATRLVMTGNGGYGTWHMIGSERQDGFTLEDVMLDGSGRTAGFAEHQHLIQIGYGSKNVLLRRLVGYHPELAPAGGGDCVQLVGGYNEDELVIGVTIEDADFRFCDRSGVAIQRSSRRVTIQRIRCKAGDQCIDIEATDAGDEFRWPQDIQIRDSIIYGNGGIALSLGRAKRIRLESTSVLNGTILFLTAHSSSLRDVNVECPDIDIACIDVRRAVRGVELANLRVVKPAGAVIPGQLIQITTDPNGSPEGVRIVGGEYVQTTPERAIAVLSAKARIEDAEFRYEGPVPGGNNATAIVVNTTSAPKPADVRVRDNTFVGTWTRGVLLGSNLGTAVIAGNVGTSQAGVFCEALGTTKARVITGNVFFKADGTSAPNTGCP